MIPLMKINQANAADPSELEKNLQFKQNKVGKKNNHRIYMGMLHAKLCIQSHPDHSLP